MTCMKRTAKPTTEPAPAVTVQRVVRRYDFSERGAGRSYQAKGGTKDWPDEWRCKTCLWCANWKPGQKTIWCRKWKQSFAATSDRACFEETIEMKMERESLAPNDKLTDLRETDGGAERKHGS